jgi:hypothetical protein
MAFQIKYDDHNHSFKGYVDNEKVSSLELWEDDETGLFWLNGIYVDKEENYGKGYASSLIRAALKHYDTIYVSIASSYEHKQNGDTTARELTADGATLVNNLKSTGVLKAEWFVNPFCSYFPDENVEG